MTNSQGPAIDNPGIFFKITTVNYSNWCNSFFDVVRGANYIKRNRKWYFLIIMAGIVAELPAALYLL